MQPHSVLHRTTFPAHAQTLGFATDGFSKLALVIELMESSLLQLLNASVAKELSWGSPLLDVSLDIARGMTYLHDRDVLHRDLKFASKPSHGCAPCTEAL